MGNVYRARSLAWARRRDHLMPQMSGRDAPRPPNVGAEIACKAVNQPGNLEHDSGSLGPDLGGRHDSIHDERGNRFGGDYGMPTSS